MPELTRRARQLAQLLEKELNKTGGPWAVMMFGNGSTEDASDLRIDLGDGDDEDWFISNASTNLADVIPINRVKK